MSQKVDLNELMERLYDRIRPLAGRIYWNNPNPSLNPTALVNEAYLKLRNKLPSDGTRTHEEVIAIFGKAMREILLDAARRRSAAKRQACDPPQNPGLPIDDAVTLNTTFDELTLKDTNAARVFECRYFLGMTTEETSAALNVSESSVERAWQEARQYVGNRLRPGVAHV